MFSPLVWILLAMCPYWRQEQKNNVDVMVAFPPVAQNHQGLAPVGGVEETEGVAPLQRRMGIDTSATVLCRSAFLANKMPV